MERVIRVDIDSDADGLEIKRILRTRFEMSSRLIAHLKAREDGITLNGERVFVTRRVKKGDVLLLKISEEEETSPNIVPTEGNLDVVYEDCDLMVINKAAGVSVHPSMGHFYDTLANFVAYRAKVRGESFTFRPVNRLDRNTSGLMIVAKNGFTQTALSRDHTRGLLRREYLALCEGVIDADSGKMDAPIAREEDSAIKRCVREDGRKAITKYTVVRRLSEATLVRVVPETGRTHQIRVHMAHMGHPLLGDFLYGRECGTIPRHALHSDTVIFTHPHTGERLHFTSPLPDDMARAVKLMDG